MTHKKTIMLSEACNEIYEYWDYEGNKGKDPRDFTYKSREKVKLYCRKHNIHYERAAYKITSEERNCRCKKCNEEIRYKSDIETGKMKSLVEYVPEIKDYWVDGLNELPMEMIPCRSNKRVTLYCKKHDFYFEKRIRNIEPNLDICPICSNRVKPLQIFYPELKKEYSEKNVIPFNYLYANMPAQVIWKCSHENCDCEWVSTVRVRTSGKSQCPNERKHKKIKTTCRIER